MTTALPFKFELVAIYRAGHYSYARKAMKYRIGFLAKAIFILGLFWNLPLIRIRFQK